MKVVKITQEAWEQMQPHTTKYARKYSYWGNENKVSPSAFTSEAILEKVKRDFPEKVTKKPGKKVTKRERIK